MLELQMRATLDLNLILLINQNMVLECGGRVMLVKEYKISVGKLCNMVAIFQKC
jgi:hypothetical protein